MTLKDDYKKIVEELKRKAADRGEKLRNEDIASTLGYERSYFSSLLGTRGNVTEDHLRHIQLQYQHLLGNTTEKQHPSEGEDYQAKYIALLEEHLEIKKALFQKIEGFEKMIEDFKKSHETIAVNFTEAAAVIEEVRKAQHVMYALQNAYYQYFLEKAGDKEDAWQTILEAAAKDLGLIQTKGIQVDLDIIHNGS